MLSKKLNYLYYNFIPYGINRNNGALKPIVFSTNINKPIHNLNTLKTFHLKTSIIHLTH